MASLAISATAHAGRFEASTGAVVFDPAAVNFGFEANAPLDGLVVTTRRGQELTAPEIEAQMVAGGIEGERALRLSSNAYFAMIDLAASAERFRGRRVEVRLWQRADGSLASPHVVWAAGDQGLADLPLQLSGRATDDGWEEWVSGPFDFELARRVPAAAVQVYPTGVGGFGGGGAPSTTAAPGVWIDALSIEDLGPAEIPDAVCTLGTEATTCGLAGVCSFGRCADATVVLGPPFLDPTLRSDYLERRGFEFTHLEGGRLPQSKAQVFLAELRDLVAEPSVGRFWTRFVAAIESLEDGHASAPQITARPLVETGVCLHLGRADLLPGAPEAPLVFGTLFGGTLGTTLRIGDALVAIDGLAVEDWRALARRHLDYSGAEAARRLVTTPGLMRAAAMTGSVLTFERPLCTRTATDTRGACAPDEIDTVTLDLGEASSIWEGVAPAWMSEGLPCDYRFRREFAAPAGTEYAFAGSVDRDGVRILQINGVPTQSEQGGDEWFTAVARALGDGPPRVILDQRTGYGGGMDAVDHLMGHLLGPGDFHQMEMLPRLVQPVDETLLETFRTCQDAAMQVPTATSGLASCGEYIGWRLAEGAPIGTARTASVAILLGYDISGNDYVTKLATYRKQGATRIFGGAPTAGAFGVIWRLPAVGHEAAGGSIQIHDTIFRATPDDRSLEFTTGYGIPPDVVVLQTQSDARRGVDTLMEAAKAWLLGRSS